MCRKLGVSKLSEITSEVDLYQALLSVAQAQSQKQRDNNSSSPHSAATTLADDDSLYQSSTIYRADGYADSHLGQSQMLLNSHHNKTMFGNSQSSVPLLNLASKSNARSQYDARRGGGFPSHVGGTGGSGFSSYGADSDLENNPEFTTLWRCILAVLQYGKSQRLDFICRDFGLAESYVSDALAEICSLLGVRQLETYTNQENLISAAKTFFRHAHTPLSQDPTSNGQLRQQFQDDIPSGRIGGSQSVDDFYSQTQGGQSPDSYVLSTSSLDSITSGPKLSQQPQQLQQAQFSTLQDIGNAHSQNLSNPLTSRSTMSSDLIQQNYGNVHRSASSDDVSVSARSGYAYGSQSAGFGGSQAQAQGQSGYTLPAPRLERSVSDGTGSLYGGSSSISAPSTGSLTARSNASDTSYTSSGAYSSRGGYSLPNTARPSSAVSVSSYQMSPTGYPSQSVQSVQSVPIHRDGTGPAAHTGYSNYTPAVMAVPGGAYSLPPQGRAAVSVSGTGMYTLPPSGSGAYLVRAPIYNLPANGSGLGPPMSGYMAPQSTPRSVQDPRSTPNTARSAGYGQAQPVPQQSQPTHHVQTATSVYSGGPQQLRYSVAAATGGLHGTYGSQDTHDYAGAMMTHPQQQQQHQHQGLYLQHNPTLQMTMPVGQVQQAQAKQNLVISYQQFWETSLRLFKSIGEEKTSCSDSVDILAGKCR